VTPVPLIVVLVSPILSLSAVDEFSSDGGADCVVSVSEVSLLSPPDPQLAKNIPGASIIAATQFFDHFIFISFNV
jgi:hypothetical protein